MSFDSLGNYTTPHKTWDHVGNMIPVVEHSEGIRPHGEFKPAAWLPVQFWEKYYENWYVMLPGKILAFDNDGRLVPAQYGLGSTTPIVYTTNDVEAGVIDVRTGSALTAAASFTVGDVTAFMGRTGVAMSVSKPVGVTSYGYVQWAGDGSASDTGFNPTAYRQHNYNMQHRASMVCDYVLELPLVPATVSAAEALTQSARANNVATLNALSNTPVALNTMRTPFTFAEGVGAPGDVAARFAVQKSTVSEVIALGDWHVNTTTGVISVYAASDIGATDYTLVYSHYASAPTTVSKFASAVGNLQPGDFVKCDGNSNFAIAVPKTSGDGETDDFDTFADIMGQVLEVENVQDKDALGRVRTAYDSIATNAAGSLPAYAGQMDQMPGSATGGVTDKVHYAGAANLVVRINLISR